MKGRIPVYVAIVAAASAGMLFLGQTQGNENSVTGSFILNPTAAGTHTLLLPGVLLGLALLTFLVCRK